MLQVLLDLQAVAETGGNGQARPNSAEVIKLRLVIEGINQALQGFQVVVVTEV